MKLIAEVNNEKINIEVNQSDETVFAEIDGRKYNLEATQPEPNVWLFKLDGKIFECHVNNFGENGIVRIGNSEVSVKLIDPKRLRGAGDSDSNAEGIAEIRTAMPGKIVKVLVKPSDEVFAGDGVIIVEAMKMQNEMKAPKDGTVKEVRFEAGETVNAGDILLVIE
jgi:biotin carboxyl carrier protein